MSNEIKVEIVGDSSKFVQELNKATKATQDFANKFKSSMDDMNKGLRDLKWWYQVSC